MLALTAPLVTGLCNLPDPIVWSINSGPPFIGNNTHSVLAPEESGQPPELFTLIIVVSNAPPKGFVTPTLNILPNCPLRSIRSTDTGVTKALLDEVSQPYTKLKYEPR